MTSSPFERQLAESETTERRPATPASRMPDGPQQYSPGPSFIEHDRPAVRLVELPAWLQAFAASVGEPSIDETDRPDEADLELLTEADMSANDKPAPRAEPEQARPAATGSSFNTSFISEDDLPEWLRSIAPEESDDSAAESLLFGNPDSSQQVTVPNVTRAWTTSSDARGVDESSSIFALVASQPTHGPLPTNDGPPAPRTSAPRQPVPGNDATTENLAGYGSAVPPPMTAEEVVASVTPDGQADAAPAAKGGLPILPIAVGVVLLLVLAIVALQMFAS